MARKCGAKTRVGGKCQHVAGHRTDHVGTGKCYLHGGASKGAPKGNKNAYKHGLYVRVFSSDDLDAAREMRGSVEHELDVARLQLLNLFQQQHKQNDDPAIQEIHESTIVQEDESSKKASFLENMKNDAERCGEEYDPDGDEQYIEAKESEVFQRKRIFQRRDFSYEITRLIALIAKLESTSLSLQQKQLAIEEAKKPKEQEQGKNDLSNLSDTELDKQFLELFK